MVTLQQFIYIYILIILPLYNYFPSLNHSYYIFAKLEQLTIDLIKKKSNLTEIEKAQIFSYWSYIKCQTKI